MPFLEDCPGQSLDAAAGFEQKHSAADALRCIRAPTASQEIFNEKSLRHHVGNRLGNFWDTAEFQVLPRGRPSARVEVIARKGEKYD